jgi:hypothetical protein
LNNLPKTIHPNSRLYADLLYGQLRGLQKVLAMLDTDVLQVVDQREPRGGLESPLGLTGIRLPQVNRRRQGNDAHTEVLLRVARAQQGLPDIPRSLKDIQYAVEGRTGCLSDSHNQHFNRKSCLLHRNYPFFGL